MSMGADSVDDVAAELGAIMKAKPPTNLRETMKLLSTALELRHAKPKRVSNGPCKEIIHKVESAELRVESWPPAPDVKNPSTFDSRLPTLLNLPILKCWPLDGGRFITLPCVVTQRPRHRRTQRRHVSHPDLRRPHHRHALAAPESRRAPRPPLLRNRHAHARRHFPRRRSRVHLRRHRAAARWPRRISARGLSAQEIRRTREVRDQRPRSPRQCRLRHRRLR